MSVDPGAGWRLLEVGELVEAGDEYRDNMAWKPVPPAVVGQEILGGALGHLPHRRRVPAATADAPLPQPVAWGVWGRGAVCGTAVSREDAVCMQREFAFDTDIRPLYADPPALSQPTPSHGDVVAALECLTSAIGCYGERIADPFTITWGNGIVALRRGVFVAGGSDHVVREVMKLDGKDHRQTTFSAAAADAPPPAPHPWCRDVDRDEAARAEEDARSVALPEWRRLQKIVTSLLDRVEALESSANLASREIRRLKSRVSELE